MAAWARSNPDVLENERAIADLLSRQASPLAFDAEALRASLKALFAWIASTWPGSEVCAECPVSATLDNGQRVVGRIDLLIRTTGHCKLGRAPRRIRAPYSVAPDARLNKEGVFGVACCGGSVLASTEYRGGLGPPSEYALPVRSRVGLHVPSLCPDRVGCDAHSSGAERQLLVVRQDPDFRPRLALLPKERAGQVNGVQGADDSGERAGSTTLHCRAHLDKVQPVRDVLQYPHGFRVLMVIQLSGHPLALQYPVALDNKEIARSRGLGGDSAERRSAPEDVRQNNRGVDVDSHLAPRSSSR